MYIKERVSTSAKQKFPTSANVGMEKHEFYRFSHIVGEIPV